MSILTQIYREAKGIEDNLSDMNKTLSEMKEIDKKSNRQEQVYRQSILTAKKREKQDRARNYKEVTDTIEKTVGKGSGKKMAEGGLMAALAVGLGAAVAKSLFDQGILGGGEDEAPAGGETTQAQTPSGSEDDSNDGSAGAAPAPPGGGKQQSQSKPGGFTAEQAGNIDQWAKLGFGFASYLPGARHVVEGAEMAYDWQRGNVIGATLSGLSLIPKVGIAFKALDDAYDFFHQMFRDEKLEAEDQQMADNLNWAQKIWKKWFPDNTQGKQTGGFTGAVPNLGQPATGDHFFTHVQPGSYILNRNAVAGMGYQSGGIPVALERGEIALPPGSYDQGMMDYMNYSAFPRFQSGGLVEASHAHTGSGYSIGKDSKGRPSVFSKSAGEALLKAIEASGGAVKTSDITSSKRSTEHNTRVGGVANSNHLTGNAVDIHGTSKAWLKENGPKYGWHNLNYSGHDGHFDFKGGGQSGTPESTGQTPRERGERTAATQGNQGGGAFGELSQFGAAGQVAMKFLKAATANGLGFLFNGLGSGKTGGRSPGGFGNSGGGGISKLGSGGGSLSGLSESDWKDLAYIVSAEAARGTDDEYGVAAAILNRVADPRFPNTIKGVGVQDGQFEAVFKGIAYDDPELAAKLQKNQDKIADALKKLEGRTDFKGTTMYANMGASDIRFAGNGNFFHYAEQTGRQTPVPENKPQEWKKWLKQQRGGQVRYMQTGGNVIAENLSALNEVFRMYEIDASNPIIIMADDTPPTVAGGGGATNNMPQYLPTRSDCWASAMLEYRERSLNVSY